MSHLRAVRNEDLSIRPLQALTRVRLDFGLPALAKPCVASVMEGDLPSTAGRHEVAFVIAVELRDLGLSLPEVETKLSRWARRIGYSERDACRVLPNAFKQEGGVWKYKGAGITKRPGTRAHGVLGGICEDVGCPHRCPAFANVVLDRSGGANSFAEFEHLGWHAFFRRRRQRAAVDVYEAVCKLERHLGFAPGARMFTSTAQIAQLASHDRRHTSRQLDLLHDPYRLLAVWQVGSGSGPNARDRVAARVARAIPSLHLPHDSPRAPTLMAAIQDRGSPAPSK